MPRLSRTATCPKLRRREFEAVPSSVVRRKIRALALATGTEQAVGLGSDVHLDVAGLGLSLHLPRLLLAQGRRLEGGRDDGGARRH